MLNIPSPNYMPLEQRVGLLLHIGRDLKKRGKAGFNIDVELSGTHIASYRIAGDERFQAYEWLLKKNLIVVSDSKTYEDLDGVATFVGVGLTEKGSSLYEQAEKAYGSYLNSLKEKFS